MNVTSKMVRAARTAYYENSEEDIPELVRFKNALKAAIEVGEEDPVVHKRGDKFKNGEDTYLLCTVSPTAMALIDITTGNRWTAWPVEVARHMTITEEEFKKLSSGGDGDFIFIEGE